MGGGNLTVCNFVVWGHEFQESFKMIIEVSDCSIRVFQYSAGKSASPLHQLCCCTLLVIYVMEYRMISSDCDLSKFKAE